MDDLRKLGCIFLLGIFVIVIGLIISFFEAVLLGVLLSGISGFILLIRITARWK